MALSGLKGLGEKINGYEIIITVGKIMEHCFSIETEFHGLYGIFGPKVNGLWELIQTH